MKRFAPRPRRPLRYDMYSLACVLAIPIAICIIFPKEIFSVEANDLISNIQSSCAFVSLSEDDYQKALSSAQAAWRLGDKDVRIVTDDLSLSTLPNEPEGAVMNIQELNIKSSKKEALYDATLLPPTKAATTPVKIKHSANTEAVQPFSKLEMLKLD